MALSVTAEVDVVARSVRLTVTGGTPDYSAVANPAGDIAPYTVRTSWAGTAGSTRVGVDGDVPLNTETQYVITDRTGAQAVTSTVVVDSEVPVIASALDPTTAIEVVVVAQKPNRWEARSVWFDVLGSRAPFAAIAPMRLRNGQLELRAERRADRAALINLLGLGHPLTFRGVCPDAVDDLILLPAAVEEVLALDEATAGATHLNIEYQAISRELGPYTSDPGRTWAQVVVEVPTWGDVLTRYLDWQALLTGDLTSGLGAEQLSAGTFPAGPAGAPWSTFWSHASIVWSGTATALATADPSATPVAAVIWQNANRPIPAGADTLRVTGRARSTSPGSTVRVEIVTNDLANPAEYFAPGSQQSSTVVAAGPGWLPFAVDIAVPNPAHEQWTLYFRGEGMASSAVVEFDDLSAKWRE